MATPFVDTHDFGGQKSTFFSFDFPKNGPNDSGTSKMVSGAFEGPKQSISSQISLLRPYPADISKFENRDFCNVLMILAFSELIWGGRIRPEVAGITIFCFVCVLGILETLLHTVDVII